MLIGLKHLKGNLSLIRVYVPEEGKVKESEIFYKALLNVVDKFGNTDQIVTGGDINARVGNRPISQCIGMLEENTMNSNGQMLEDFVSFNELKIQNTFFKK